MTPVVAAIRSLAAVLRRLPPRAARRAGRGLGRLYGRLAARARAQALDALGRSFPDRDAAWVRATAREMFAQAGEGLVESLRLLRPDPAFLRERIFWDGRERLEAALARGRGVLVLTAHAGNWELLCRLMPSLGHPTAILSKPVKGRGLDAFTRGVRAAFGLQVLPARGSYRDALRVLKRNELLGFVIDQNMTRDEGVFVEFFGRPACTTPGLAHLAAVSRAPVVPMFLDRQPDGRHAIRVQPALAPPPDRKPETLLAATQAYSRVVEEWIRAHPAQWIWMHRRWRTRPPADAAQTDLPPPAPAG